MLSVLGSRLDIPQMPAPVAVSSALLCAVIHADLNIMVNNVKWKFSER